MHFLPSFQKLVTGVEEIVNMNFGQCRYFQIGFLTGTTLCLLLMELSEKRQLHTNILANYIPGINIYVLTIALTIYRMENLRKIVC